MMSLILLLAAVAPQSSPPPTLRTAPLHVPPPPALHAARSDAGPSNVALVVFQPGNATCDGEPVAGSIALPIPAAAALAQGQAVAPYVFTFRIGEDGRPLSIAPAPRSMPGLYFRADDLQPALAASRFPAGRARDRCSISFAATATPVADAPIDQVFRYLAMPHTRSYLDAPLRKRVRDLSPGCFNGTPMVVLNRAFPDYSAIPQPPGALSTTIVSYDIDARGKPARVRTLTSDGNAALDAAARAAVGKSRYGRTARTGCTMPFFRRQSIPLAPPPPTSMVDYRANPACTEGSGRWELPPRMTFPEPFRRRAIEGWAVIRYDYAPWGQTGNVTVLASEPAAMFGEQARQIIQAARRPPSATGATGCVERVLFKLPEGMTDAPASQPIDE